MRALKIESGGVDIFDTVSRYEVTKHDEEEINEGDIFYSASAL